MREILFRGKRLDNSEWVLSGNIIRFIPENGEDLVFIPALSEPCVCNHDEKDNIISFEKGMFYKVDPKTVGQYTGLNDKNGKRIFEGDIVVFNRGRNLPNTVCLPEVIKYHQGDCAYQRYPLGRCVTRGGAGKLIQPDMMLECEVVGNVHDNPELLKGGDEE